ncbi:Spastin [Galdieria sulphuraria]|nr:Spastin [Galdieria sulphuraria]
MATLSTQKISKLNANSPFSCYEACKKQLLKAVDWDEKSELTKALKEYVSVAERLRSLLRNGQGSMTREKWIDFQNQVSKTLGLVDERIDALSKSTNSSLPVIVDKTAKKHNVTGTQLRSGRNKTANMKGRLSPSEKNENFEKILGRIQSEIVVSSPGIKWDQLKT